MEEKKETILPEEEKQGYEPRPAGQVWTARFCLVLFVGFVIYQLVSIASGGL